MAFRRPKARFIFAGMAVALAAVLVALHPALAVDPFALPTTVTVSKIISGSEFALADYRIVGLEGIEVPLPETQSLADQSRAMLEKLTGGKELTLENTSIDRYGRIAAQIYTAKDDGPRIRIQEAMLREGLAYVYPPTGEEPGLDTLFAAENEARKAKRGLWADAFYADTPDTKAGKKIGHFAFVRGKVLEAERVKDKVYLNFGEDRKKDFTIIIAAHDLASFRKADVDPLAYKGETIRVRGWVTRKSGPTVTVTAPQQIQVIKNP